MTNENVLELNLRERATRPVVINLEEPYNGLDKWEVDAYVLTEMQAMLIYSLTNGLQAGAGPEKIHDIYTIFKDILRDPPEHILFAIRPSDLLKLMEYLTPEFVGNKLSDETQERIRSMVQRRDHETSAALQEYFESVEGDPDEDEVDRILRTNTS